MWLLVRSLSVEHRSRDERSDRTGQATLAHRLPVCLRQNAPGPTMTLTAWLLLACVLVLDTGSHLLLKSASYRVRASDGVEFVLALIAQPRLWVAIGSFIALFFAWIGFISLVPLSQGIMAGSITIAGVMIGGRIFFGESITPSRALSIGLIAAGVLLVGLGG